MQFKSKAREAMVQEFIKCLKENKIPWEKPWSVIKPYNGATQRQFTGSYNLFALQVKASIKGYKDPRWCTFKQANDNGWAIKKNEKATFIEFWSGYDVRTKKNLTILDVNILLQKDPEAKQFIKIIAKTYSVFNAEQIEGIPFLETNSQTPSHDEKEFTHKCETVISALGVKVKNSGDKAFYSPRNDYINMPQKENFKNLFEYGSTLLHEGAHATGHNTRLNRKMEGKFGSSDYAKEELRAEIASAFMSGNLALSYCDSHINSHKAYIQSWISILENDPKELFNAIQEADSICNYMLELYPDKNLEIEDSLSLDDRIKNAKEKIINKQNINHIERSSSKEVGV